MIEQQRSSFSTRIAEWRQAAPRALLSMLIGGCAGLCLGLLLAYRSAAPTLVFPLLALLTGGAVALAARGLPARQPVRLAWALGILAGLGSLLGSIFWPGRVPIFAALGAAALACLPAARILTAPRPLTKRARTAAVALLSICVLAGGGLGAAGSTASASLTTALWFGAVGLLYGLLDGLVTGAAQRDGPDEEIETALYAGVTLAAGAAWLAILWMNAGSAGLPDRATGALVIPLNQNPAAFSDLHFTSNRDGPQQVYRQSVSTGLVERVTAPGKGECWGARVGANGALYVTCERADGRQIFRQDPQTGSFVQMTNPPNGECWGPALGPGGNTFFTCNRDGKRAIFYQDSATGSVLRMTSPGQGESWDPALGPAGELYFTSNREGSRQIYRMPKGGGSAVRVTAPGKGECWSPALGADGDLYFTCQRDGSRQVYRLRHDTGAVDRMTLPANGENWGPVLGPAGNIHFTSNRGGKREVYRIDHTTGKVERVTSTSAGESWTVDER